MVNPATRAFLENFGDEGWDAATTTVSDGGVVGGLPATVLKVTGVDDGELFGSGFMADCLVLVLL